MKKLGSLLLILLLVFALTACDSIPKDSGGSSDNSSGSSDASGDSSDKSGDSSSSSGNEVYAEDGFGEGRMGDIVHTYFFDFTVNSAYTTTDYNGFKPSQDDRQLLVVNLTLKNTYNSSITMWDSDFQAQWSNSQEAEEAEEFAYSWPITDDGNVPTVSDDQLPAEYDLAVSEERTGELVFEVPADEKDFSISTLEIFDNGTEEGEEGDTFFVFFTATAQ